MVAAGSVRSWSRCAVRRGPGPATGSRSCHPRDRARDVTAAFADPTVTAVPATVGGDDLITVTPHLDDAVLRANPKPYFGYSDNTNLLNHLHRLGIVVDAVARRISVRY